MHSTPESEPAYVLSSDNPWAHIIQPPREFWRTYCGARADWEIHKFEDADRLCAFCLVLEERDDADNQTSQT